MGDSLRPWEPSCCTPVVRASASDRSVRSRRRYVCHARSSPRPCRYRGTDQTTHGRHPGAGSAPLLRTRSQPVLTRGGARARLRREPPATPTLDRHFDNPPVDLVDPRAPGARGRPRARSRRDGRRVRQRHRRPRPRTVRHGPRQRDAGAPGQTGLSPCLDPTVRTPICPSLSSAVPAAVSARAAPTWRSTARTCSRWLGPPPLPPGQAVVRPQPPSGR
jgi:hypothetical protein